jgi:hypothetical protein
MVGTAYAAPTHSLFLRLLLRSSLFVVLFQHAAMRYTTSLRLSVTEQYLAQHTTVQNQN